MKDSELRIFVKVGNTGYWFKCESLLSKEEARELMVAVANPENHDKVWVSKAVTKA